MSPQEILSNKSLLDKVGLWTPPSNEDVQKRFDEMQLKFSNIGSAINIIEKENPFIAIDNGPSSFEIMEKGLHSFVNSREILLKPNAYKIPKLTGGKSPKKPIFIEAVPVEISVVANEFNNNEGQKPVAGPSKQPVAGASKQAVTGLSKLRKKRPVLVEPDAASPQDPFDKMVSDTEKKRIEGKPKPTR